MIERFKESRHRITSKARTRTNQHCHDFRARQRVSTSDERLYTRISRLPFCFSINRYRNIFVTVLEIHTIPSVQIYKDWEPEDERNNALGSREGWHWSGKLRCSSSRPLIFVWDLKKRCLCMITKQCHHWSARYTQIYSIVDPSSFKCLICQNILTCPKSLDSAELKLGRSKIRC